MKVGTSVKIRNLHFLNKIRIVYTCINIQKIYTYLNPNVLFFCLHIKKSIINFFPLQLAILQAIRIINEELADWQWEETERERCANSIYRYIFHTSCLREIWFNSALTWSDTILTTIKSHYEMDNNYTQWWTKCWKKKESQEIRESRRI